jgi:hypothetical protein
LSLRWLNLGNQPVQVLIEDLYILVVPRKEDDQDPDELERRMQEIKLERLQKAEALQMKGDGVNGMNSCLKKTAADLTAFKMSIVRLKTKASLHHSSQSF